MSNQERNIDLTPWAGQKRPYDLVKEFVIALALLTILIGTSAALFSSPDEKAQTLQDWAIKAPNDFVTTSAMELAGTTISASYGPPYNSASEGLSLGPLKLQKWAGVTIPVEPARDFIISPLAQNKNRVVFQALSEWSSAGAAQKSAWAQAYIADLGKSKDYLKLTKSPKYGPVPEISLGALSLAQDGILEAILTNQSTPYPSDYTKSMLFLADGGYFDDLGAAQHLHGDQMGMMNETGSYPGQSWLWLFSSLYQIEPLKSSPNADSQIFAVLLLLNVGFIFLPKIPYLNRLPKYIPIHRLIWKRYYRENQL